VYDVAIETSLDHAPILSRRCKNKVYFKREDQQPVFSFKLRGAYNKMHNLMQTGDCNGVISASAGNHAQGVALSARYLGLPATIVMPETTPSIKVDAVKELGATAVLVGDSFEEAYAHSLVLQKEQGLHYIHPFDDEDTIAGQGTIAMEICRQINEDIEAIFVPVGGGGLIAGIAVYIKYLWPHVKIIGVEPDNANAMALSLKAGKRIILDEVGLFADGVAVKQVGKLPFELCQKYVDDVVLVSSDEICAALKDIFDDTRSLTEPAGALAAAGLKKYLAENQITDKKFVVINSGANINFDRLRHVAERAELGEKREVLLSATIPEEKGSFKQFCGLLGKTPITEFNYRYSDSHVAQVFVGLKVNNTSVDGAVIIQALRDKKYHVTDMSDNEMAKLHVRYMVGGNGDGLSDERIFRFQFPERPLALQSFLDKVGQNWNISLFHYRNHGADFGRVLVGVQIPESDRVAFKNFINGLNFPYWEETDNPIYSDFLQ
jgi:threonine dehydratase